MKPEDFESEMRNADPAKDLAKLSESELQTIAVSSIAAAPSKSAKTTKVGRGLIAAAVAALIAVPALNGAMTADGPPVLRLGASSEGLSSTADQRSSDMAENSKLSMSYFFGAYKFELADGVTIAAGTGTGYTIVPRPDAENVIQKLASYFDISELTYDKQGKSWSNNHEGEWNKPAIWGYLEGAWASFNYNNPDLDPWNKCYNTLEQPISSEDTVTEVECEPKPATNLPTDSEATDISTNLLEEIGVDLTGFEATVDSSEYNTWVSFDNPAQSYAYYSVTLGNNGAVSGVYGSLTELSPIGEYDLIDSAAAIERANAQADRYIKQMEDGGAYGPEVMLKDESNASEPRTKDGDSAEPNPGDDSAYEAPVFEVKTVVVTKIELIWSMNYASDGSALWLPTYNFYGYVKGEGNKVSEYPMHNMIAIVDSQIDLDSFWSFGIGYGGGSGYGLTRDIMPMID
jgi:hypothetical protein